jgi:acetyltransferase-like isoleucine patch superfamily enzyme
VARPIFLDPAPGGLSRNSPLSVSMSLPARILSKAKALRNWLLRRVYWRRHHIGPGFHCGRNVVMWARHRISIGENCYIGRHSQIECDAQIGNNVIMANMVSFVGRYDHDYEHVGTPTRLGSQIRDPDYNWKGLHLKAVVEDDVWIGYGATILSGVTIGEGSIVASGSVVTKNVLPFSIVGGNPAKVIAQRFPEPADRELHRLALAARRRLAEQRAVGRRGRNPASGPRRPRVLVVQEHLPAFRTGFYKSLRERLAGAGFELDLVFAPNQRNTFQKGRLDWAIPVPIRWIGPLGWQPVLKLARRADLVVVQQENKYAVNPVLQLFALCGGTPVAYWGHGINFQAAGRGGLAARLKKFLANRVHWWFAYNNLSATKVAGYGFPPERITAVMNAIDTRAIRKTLDELPAGCIDEVRRELALGAGPVAVYTGGLYPLKRIEFLLQACLSIRRVVPGFEMIFIGSGPDSGKVSAAAADHPWIHFVGPKDDREKVPYWAVSQLLLMPGGVGLVVLDSFALGVPMVTTAEAGHGPEIDYLENGVNGLIVRAGDDPEAYATAVAAILRDPERLAGLRTRAREAGDRYSIEDMAERFTAGVVKALEAHKRS